MASVMYACMLTITYMWRAGTDRHDVDGLIVNFGTETAYNAKIELTWDLGIQGSHVATIELGNVWGHYIGEISETFYFEFDGPVSWEITWD